MAGMGNLEFRRMAPGQGEEVSRLVLEVAHLTEENGFTPTGKAAFERYVSAVALEERSRLGYRQELAYVGGVLAGVIELKEPDRISMLYVRGEYAKKGLGSRLLVRAAARCTACAPRMKHISVYATDDAVNFYERVGFSRSGPRQLQGGVYSTPYKRPLKPSGKSLPSKLHAQAVEMFVFTGTGNSLLLAQTVAEVLRQEGLAVSLNDMERSAVAPKDTAIGLVFPVACFSTYPTVWRFVRSMPLGEGREVFMIGTMGGISGGMQGPLRALLIEKGYKPVAAQFFVMPGNYGNKTLPLERNTSRVETALTEARFFAYNLIKGSAAWGGGVPLVSALLHRLAQTRRPWNWFYKTFPIAVDREKCVRCGRCAEFCPEKALRMEEGFPVIDGAVCQSCQRCVGFCPQSALGVPHKPAEPYCAMSFEDFRAAFSSAERPL